MFTIWEALSLEQHREVIVSPHRGHEGGRHFREEVLGKAGDLFLLAKILITMD